MLTSRPVTRIFIWFRYRQVQAGGGVGPPSGRRSVVSGLAPVPSAVRWEEGQGRPPLVCKAEAPMGSWKQGPPRSPVAVPPACLTRGTERANVFWGVCPPVLSRHCWLVQIEPFDSRRQILSVSRTDLGVPSCGGDHTEQGTLSAREPVTRWSTPLSLGRALRVTWAGEGKHT